MEGQYCRFYYTNPDKPDLQELLMREGLDGYGAYWLIIALLGRTDEHIYPTDYKRLAWAIHTEDVELVERVVCNFGLFVLTDDGEQFYCDWLKTHCDAVDIVKTKRSEAGKKGMQTRWGTPSAVPVKTETKPARPKQSENRGKTCSISPQPSEAEQKALDDAGMVPTEDWRHATPTYSKETTDLLEDIAAKFNVIPLPAHVQMLENLLQAVHRPGVVDGITVVRDGLAKLDTAKGVLAGKPKMTITKFFDERIFMKLINGDYDECYTEKKKAPSKWQDAGKTFDEMTY